MAEKKDGLIFKKLQPLQGFLTSNGKEFLDVRAAFNEEVRITLRLFFEELDSRHLDLDDCVAFIWDNSFELEKLLKDINEEFHQMFKEKA